jgi:tetratricopeptide (TPR) repeat protein
LAFCAGLAFGAAPDDCASWSNRGVSAKDPSKRIEFFSKAIEACGGRREIQGLAYFRRGENLLFKKGEKDKAIEDFSRAIASGQKLSLAFTCRGFAFFQKGDFQSAIADFTQALKADPGLSEAYTFRGLSYDRLGLYDQAIADLGRASKLPQQNPELLEFFRPAEAAVPAAEKKAPGGPSAASLFADGKRFLGAGDLAGARESLERASALDPGNVEMRNWLGSVYCQMGAYQKGVVVFQMICNSKGVLKVWNYYWGVCLCKLGRFDEAHRVLSDALSDGRGKNRGEDRRADAREALGKIDEYRRRLHQGRKLASRGKYADAQAELAAAAAVFDTREARAELERAGDERLLSGKRRLLLGAFAAAAALLAGCIAYLRLRRPATSP